MDPTRFDRFTKTLAGGTSRRRLLRGLGGTLGGAALAAVGRGGAGAAPACRGEGHPCAGNQTCCGDLVCEASGPGKVPRCTAVATCLQTGSQCYLYPPQFVVPCCSGHCAPITGGSGFCA